MRKYVLEKNLSISTQTDTRKKKREIRSYVISENDFGVTQGSKPDVLGLQNVSRDTIQYPYTNKVSQKPWTDADLQNDHFCAYKKLSSTRISKLFQKQKRSFPGIPKTKSSIFIKAKLRVVLKAKNEAERQENFQNIIYRL